MGARSGARENDAEIDFPFVLFPLLQLPNLYMRRQHIKSYYLKVISNCSICYFGINDHGFICVIIVEFANEFFEILILKIF